MTAIRQRMRRPKATRRLPVAELRELVRDHRSWCRLGLVYEPDSGSHYELVVEGSTLVDVLVEVEIVPDRIPLTCRLSSVAGGSGIGIWTIPAVGDEVIVAVPDGDIAFAPTIVALLSTGDIPNPSGQGPAPGRTIIVNDEVLVHDGSGGAVPLALKSDVQEVVDAIKNSAVLAGDGGATYKSNMTAVLDAAGTPSGTSILKAR